MSDYNRIADAIKFIVNRANSQPTLDEIAAHVNLSSYHFQRLFSRWAGVTPKRFLQVLTLEHAKQLLNESKSLLEVTDTVGLSSSSRLYDHFVHLEAMTPGEFKKGGTGLMIEYAVHATPFGNAFIARTPRGVCRFAFIQHDAVNEQVGELHRQWPNAQIHENDESTHAIVGAMFRQHTNPDGPLSLHVSGTNFQISVWKALLNIPPAKVVSYSQVADAIGRPGSARAVGTAIGANPVAFLIPCHRVIQQSGQIGGYHWGGTRKQAMHVWESARYD